MVFFIKDELNSERNLGLWNGELTLDTMKLINNMCVWVCVGVCVWGGVWGCVCSYRQLKVKSSFTLKFVPIQNVHGEHFPTEIRMF